MTLINQKERGKVKTLTWFLILAAILPIATALDPAPDYQAFTGQIKELSLDAVEGLSYQNFSVLIDEELISEFSVENISETEYDVLFRVPNQEGDYNLKIIVGTDEFVWSLEVSSVKLKIQTTHTLFSMSNLAYALDASSYAIGFASENQPNFTTNTVVVETIKKPAYIFLTSPTAQLNYINNQLIKQEFSTQINPLFGFSGLPSYFLSVYLSYPDIDIVGNQSFGFGRHNLVIERVTGDAPKTVRVSSSDVQSSELITTQG